MSCDVTEEACSGVVAVVVFKLRAVRLGSTVQESWLWIWLHVWCVIGNWLEMAHIEGNSWVVVLVCEPCQVGHVDCWLWSHVIASGSISTQSSRRSTTPPLPSPMASSSSTNFQYIFNASLQAYDNKTKNKLLDHPLATQLQSCDSPHAVLTVLQDLVQQFDRRCTNDERLKNWLDPTVNVLYAFSDTLGEGVGLVSLGSLSH